MKSEKFQRTSIRMKDIIDSKKRGVFRLGEIVLPPFFVLLISTPSYIPSYV